MMQQRVIRFMYLVTTVTPMKRGLKDYMQQMSNRFMIRTVTTVTPMKRGLKVRNKSSENYLFVTTVTPMKRGLKGYYRATNT